MAFKKCSTARNVYRFDQVILEVRSDLVFCGFSGDFPRLIVTHKQKSSFIAVYCRVCGKLQNGAILASVIETLKANL